MYNSILDYREECSWKSTRGSSWMRTRCDHLHLWGEQGVLQLSYDPHKALISEPGVSLGCLERHREAAKIHKYCLNLSRMSRITYLPSTLKSWVQGDWRETVLCYNIISTKTVTGFFYSPSPVAIGIRTVVYVYMISIYKPFKSRHNMYHSAYIIIDYNTFYNFTEVLWFHTPGCDATTLFHFEVRADVHVCGFASMLWI